jgi:hypothetical protein
MPDSIQGLAASFNPGDEHFTILLRTDGTGLIRDEDYGQILEITHKRNLVEYVASNDAIVLSDCPNDSFPEHIYTEMDVEDLQLDDIFYEHNDSLDNPVGDNEEPDCDLTFDVGTEEEFEKALCVVSYLANCAGLDSYIAVSAGTDSAEPKTDQYDGEIVGDLLESILAVFNPIGYTWEYTDQNDGRTTAYAQSSSYFERHLSDAEKEMPSARERLESKKWLETLLRTYDADMEPFYKLCTAIADYAAQDEAA